VLPLYEMGILGQVRIFANSTGEPTLFAVENQLLALFKAVLAADANRSIHGKLIVTQHYRVFAVQSPAARSFLNWDT